MQRQELLDIIQSYIGMTPADTGAANWSQMQQRMADEIMALPSNKEPIPDKVKVNIGYTVSVKFVEKTEAYYMLRCDEYKIINNKPFESIADLCEHFEITDLKYMEDGDAAISTDELGKKAFEEYTAEISNKFIEHE